MDTNSQHKDILFLVSLSPEIIIDLEKKNIDYSYFLNKIRSFANVDFRESISKENLAIANHYKIVIVIGHRKGESLELSDRSLFPMADIVTSLPFDFSGVIDVSVCNSTVIHDAIKKHCPNALVQTANEKTGIDFRLPLYSILLNHLPANINYRDAYILLLKRMEAKQSLIPKQELENRPTTTKLGTESKDDIRSSVFMPEKVTRGEFFQLQIKMHLDIDTGTLYFDDAKGNDPNTAQRKKNVAIKNIKIGDELTLNLCFLDAKDRNPIPTEQIKIKKGLNKEGLNSIDNIYTLGITISEENQTLVLHVKIANEYIYSKFFTIIEFVKDGKPLIEPFDLETEFKTEISQSNIERLRGDIGGNQKWKTSNPGTQRISKQCMPEELATEEAMTYWQELKEKKFVDEQYLLLPNTTRQQATYIADCFSEKLKLKTKWKLFENFWHKNNLAQEKWYMIETGKDPSRSDEIRAIFG